MANLKAAFRAIRTAGLLLTLGVPLVAGCIDNGQQTQAQESISQRQVVMGNESASVQIEFPDTVEAGKVVSVRHSIRNVSAEPIKILGGGCNGDVRVQAQAGTGNQWTFQDEANVGSCLDSFEQITIEPGGSVYGSAAWRAGEFGQSPTFETGQVDLTFEMFQVVDGARLTLSESSKLEVSEGK